MGQMHMPLVLEKTLFPEAIYSGIVGYLREKLPCTMEIQPDAKLPSNAIARLPTFNFHGYEVSICPGPGFQLSLSRGPGYCDVSNPWYKPLEELVKERQQQPLTIANITCNGSRELFHSQYKKSLEVLYGNKAEFKEIYHSVQLDNEPPSTEEKVHNAIISARIPYPSATIGIIYSRMQFDSATRDLVSRPNLRVFYSNNSLNAGIEDGHTRAQDLLVFEALVSTLVGNPSL